jgi:hypothetical protein
MAIISPNVRCRIASRPNSRLKGLRSFGEGAQIAPGATAKAAALVMA